MSITAKLQVRQHMIPLTKKPSGGYTVTGTINGKQQKILFKDKSTPAENEADAKEFVFMVGMGVSPVVALEKIWNIPEEDRKRHRAQMLPWARWPEHAYSYPMLSNSNPRKLPEWVKLHGQLFMNTVTGVVQMRYSDWYQTDIVNVRKSNMYQDIITTYGKPNGEKVRMKAAAAVMKALRSSGVVTIKGKAVSNPVTGNPVFISIARWATSGGKYWYELFERPDGSYYYRCDNGGGNLGSMTRKEAIMMIIQRTKLAKSVDGINLKRMQNPKRRRNPSVYLITPISDKAKTWVKDHVQLEGWQWMGSGFGVDHHYAADIVAGMFEDGLEQYKDFRVGG